MITWAKVRGQISRKVNDRSGTKYTVSLIDCFNDALVWLASVHTAYASMSEFEGGESQYPLPENAVMSDKRACVQAVYDSGLGIWYDRADFFPGSDPGDGFYVWPDGYVNLSPTPTGTVQLHYLAHYAEVEDDTSPVMAPAWSLEALKLYTAGRVLEDTSAQMALLGNFRTRVDSGNPEHNPLLRLSERYIQQAWDAVNAHSSPHYSL